MVYIRTSTKWLLTCKQLAFAVHNRLTGFNCVLHLLNDSNGRNGFACNKRMFDASEVVKLHCAWFYAYWIVFACAASAQMRRRKKNNVMLVVEQCAIRRVTQQIWNELTCFNLHSSDRESCKTLSKWGHLQFLGILSVWLVIRSDVCASCAWCV